MQHSARNTGLSAHLFFATTLIFMDFTIEPVPNPGQGVMMMMMMRRKRSSRRSNGDGDGGDGGDGGEDGCGGGGLMRLLMVLK